MKSILSTLLLAASLAFLTPTRAAAEDLNLLAENTFGQEGSSETITLNLGDTAKLVYASRGFNARLRCVIATKVFNLSCFKPGSDWVLEPVVIAGPATITLKSGGPGNDAQSGFVTLQITRAGITSSSTSIPQEAGSTWQVILESSSNMVDWTPVNPGDYSGTEVNRFFRTRIVKKPTP